MLNRLNTTTHHYLCVLIVHQWFGNLHQEGLTVSLHYPMMIRKALVGLKWYWQKFTGTCFRALKGQP